MFDVETTALLRAVLEEVCAGVSAYETGARARVASEILKAARRGEKSVEHLTLAGRVALAEELTSARAGA